MAVGEYATLYLFRVRFVRSIRFVGLDPVFHVIIPLMADATEELPLFPLETVLFPYATLQLHVFEERYRELVKRCLDEDRPFGVVLIREGFEVGGPADPFMVGTAARIVQAHTFEDGRLDLQVQGERRFRIRRLDDSLPYLVGHVEPVIELESEESPRIHALLSRTQESFQLLIQRLLARPNYSVHVVLPADPVALSFTVANLLRLDNRQKQRLLETTDTEERLSGLLPILENQLLEAEASQPEPEDPLNPRAYRLRPSDLQDWICNN